MRTKLHALPSVALSDVNEYEETFMKHAKIFAHNQAAKNYEKRDEKTITDHTAKGSRAKIAACLSNGRDPIEAVDWVCMDSGFSEGYTYLGDRESYLIQVKLEDILDDKIRVSFPSRKYSYMIAQIEKHKAYSRFTEFITYDEESELYFHLGRLSTDKFKEPVDATKYNVIFEFDISPQREDGLLVLS